MPLDHDRGTRAPASTGRCVVNLRRIEEEFDAASLDEFDTDPDAELFELSDDDELDDQIGDCSSGLHF
jgi:hypothetical protein